ncbi:MAG: (d)CMP kinase [Candidatus Rokuibacteriota bacterium]|nr:MAG: (d)CMP kinase [Candidatus Rokubacteria bacterium]
MKRQPVVTIDGPAAAGKSTAARELARRLGFTLVDTGALYRALAWAVKEAGVAADDAPAVGKVLEKTTVDFEGGRVIVNGRDITAQIRTPELGMLTSRLTRLQVVRDKLTPLQRRLARAGGVVLEGRDTGSVVCPWAEVKFYLDADLDERARRRREELAATGLPADYETVKAEVTQRDRQDMERDLAPLVRPEGALVLDSTALSPEAVVERMLDAVEQARCCTRS